MNLKKLNRIELDQRIKTLAQKEREVLCEILFTIKEIDGRRAYLEFGFPSLFDYLTKSIGYSEGSAQRRIDAARLLAEIPEIASKIQSGEIKLNQVSLIQKTAREFIRTRGIQVSASEKLMLLDQISSMNQATSQAQVASFFDMPVLKEAKCNVQTDGSVRVEMTLSKDQFEKIKAAQELLSHLLTSDNLPEFLELVSDKIIKQKAGVRFKEQSTESSTATVAVNNRAIPLPIRKKEMLSQKCCQFKDKEGNQCQSRWQLQVDHIRPRWAGGSNEIENLQILCSQHNRLKYRKEAGIEMK